MSAGSSLSENLVRLRISRDMSQEKLAGMAGLSVDTVARIERAETKTTRPSTVEKLALALKVTPTALLGLPTGEQGSDATSVADLRSAITATEEIPGLGDFTENTEVMPVDVLAATAHRAWRNYVNGEHAELLVALPILLVDARRLAHVSRDDAKAHAHRILSTAYRLGAGIAGRFELDDLAWTSAERALHAARQSGTPEIETAISLRYLVWTMIRQGRLEDAEQVAIRAAEQIEPRMLDRDPAKAGVFGNLLFNAAAAASRAGRTARANDLLAEAEAAAVRSGQDDASEAAIFGPRVAALQRVEHAVTTGDPEMALRLAEQVPGPQGLVPAFWEAGHRLMLASAAANVRDDRRALRYLGEARDLAPAWVKQQPLGTKTMRRLAGRAARRRGPAFADLAAHYGVIGSV